jgi:hypothetical protein
MPGSGANRASRRGRRPSSRVGVDGPGRLLTLLFTKNVLETALNEEMTEHLGHEKNRAESGRESTKRPERDITERH